MKEIDCNIIKDMLPLYMDGVVSKETKDMVEKHLGQCQNCEAELELMREQLSIPMETRTQYFEKFKKTWLKKKLVIAVLSIVLTAAFCLFAFEFLFHFGTYIPYNQDIIRIEEQSDGALNAHYYGIDYSGVSGSHPMPLIIDGVEKNVAFLRYEKSILGERMTVLLGKDKKRDERLFLFQLVDKDEDVDMVCYADFNLQDRERTIETSYWQEILDSGTIIWERSED